MSFKSMAAGAKRNRRIATEDFVEVQRQCENCTQCSIALETDVEYVCNKMKELIDAGYSEYLRYYPDYSTAKAKALGKKRLETKMSKFAKIITPEEANGENIVVPGVEVPEVETK